MAPPSGDRWDLLWGEPSTAHTATPLLARRPLCLDDWRHL